MKVVWRPSSFMSTKSASIVRTPASGQPTPASISTTGTNWGENEEYKRVDIHTVDAMILHLNMMENLY